MRPSNITLISEVLTLLLGPLDSSLGLVIGSVVNRDRETLICYVEREVLIGAREGNCNVRTHSRLHGRI